MGSVRFEAARTALDTVAVWTVHVHIPALGVIPAKDFYWSTGDNIELEDGNVYEQALRDVPRGRHQKDRGNDYAEFSVANPNNALYERFKIYEDLMETAEVVISECFEIDKGLYESEVKFFGYVKDYTNNTQELELTFTAMSDMSRPNHLVGNRILTRERCGTNFNVNGLIPPNTPGVPCTWQTAQGGNPLLCTKFLKGVDGCEAHNNTHQYYAVEGYKIADVEILPGGGIDETGFPYDSGPRCFTGRMHMVMDREFNTLPLTEVKAGMTHLAFDIGDFKERSLYPSTIQSAEAYETDHYWKAGFDMAVIECAFNHLFYVGKRYFAPVGRLADQPAHGTSLDGKVRLSFLNRMERVSETDLFYQFTTSSAVYIICDADKRFFYFVHNAKMILPMS